MKDQNKTKAQLIDELSVLRDRVAAFEGGGQTFSLDEKQALLSNDMAQKYLDIAGVIFVVIGRDHRVVLINKKGSEVLGYPKEEIIGKNWYETFIPDYGNKEDLLAGVEKIMSGNLEMLERHENPVKTRSGEERMIRWHNTLLRNAEGAIVASLSSGEDITDIKEKDRLLRESERRLQLAFEGGNLGVWDWDVQSGKVIPNERWAEMMGYTLDEIQKDYGFWEEIVHPDDLPRVTEALKDHLEGRTDSYESEYRLRAKSGEWRHILSRGKVFEHDEKGKPIRAVGVNIDVTEQKRIQEALKQANQEILEVSTPILQVWEGLAIVPLIGTLDSERTQFFMERFLTSIVEKNSTVALVDITGVPTVDTQTAQYLIEAITAARLLGTRVILTGIRAAIAQTIVQLGVDLAEIETHASLAQGLSAALKMLKVQMIRADS